MPKSSVSEEELQLRKRARRRLVGAIVLVLLVIVVVPMFLDHTEHKQPVQDIDVRIPPIPGQQAPPVPATAPAVPPVQQQPAAQPPATPPPQAQPPSPPETQVVISPPVVPAPPKPMPAPAAKPAAAQEGFVIQLGAYSKPATAKQLLQKLKSQKFPAYTEPVKTPQGTRTRVRAGPYPTMDAAEKARERMRSLKLMPVSDAKVVPMGE